MTDLSFGSLFVVALVALAAPLLVSLAPRARVPADVVAIVAGIVLGPSVLGWVEIDAPIAVLALLGLAFLLFLAGLELDLDRLRGPVLRLTAAGFGLSIALGAAAGLAFGAAGWVRSPLLVGVALSATSLGLVVPILKDAGQLEEDLGQLVVAGASIADFGAILLLSFLFSQSTTGTPTRLVLLAGLGVLAVVVALGLSRASMSMGLDALLTRLQDTTAEIRVRIAVVLLVAFVAVAQKIGLEAILGAFMAGAVLAVADRDVRSHPRFRLKLEAIGYGFLVPVFFVASGIRFDLQALTSSPAAFARVPLFLAALLIVRGLPAALYSRRVGRRGAVAAGLLQATSLPFLVTAVQIGSGTGAVSPATGAALVFAGLLSVVVFPVTALAVLDRGERAARSPSPGRATAAGRSRRGTGDPVPDPCDDLDASNLMLPIVGFLPADDARVLATIDAIAGRLTDDHGLVYRYRTAGGANSDGLAGEEGTFLLCTFWLAQALALAGRTDQARDVFGRAIRYVNDVGLLAEEVDAGTGELLGNFPQAFSHIGLINAANAIADAEQRAAPQ